MIVEYIRYHIPTERQGDFEAAYDDAQVVLSSFPWCRSYELSHCIEDPLSYRRVP